MVMRQKMQIIGMKFVRFFDFLKNKRFFTENFTFEH